MTSNQFKLTAGIGLAVLLAAACYWYGRFLGVSDPAAAGVPGRTDRDATALPVPATPRPINRGVVRDRSSSSIAEDKSKTAQGWREQRYQNLIDDLSNSEWKIRRGAAAVLKDGELPAEMAVPALIDALEDEEWHVRKVVAEALAVYQENAIDAVPSLIKALGDEEWHVRKPAADALAAIGSKANEAVPALVTSLSDDEWQVRNAAAMALTAIPNQQAVASLSDALADEQWHVAANASMALAEIGPSAESAVPRLVIALDHEEWHVRNNAAYALGLIGPELAVDSLATLLNDPEPQVSETVKQALARISEGGRAE